jgi:hypothetical protein
MFGVSLNVIKTIINIERGTKLRKKNFLSVNELTSDFNFKFSCA